MAMIGSHVVAFAGMGAFESIQEMNIYEGSVFRSYANVAVSALAIWLLFLFASWARRRIAKREEGKLAWKKECHHAEHETAGLMLGLLLSQSIRFSISGYQPPLHSGENSHAQKDKSFFEVLMLFAVSVVLGAIVIPSEMAITKLSEQLVTAGTTNNSRRRKWIASFVRGVRETLSMTMAWCLVYWSRWAFWRWTSNSGLGWGDKMTALLIMALFLSALSFAGIFVIEFAETRMENTSKRAHLAGLVALGEALGLVMGLAWETAFHEAVEGISELEVIPLGAGFNKVGLIFLLCLVILPAWMWYVLPEAKEREFSNGKNGNPTSSVDENPGYHSSSSEGAHAK